ncbi:MAG TPA: prenyltransferase/squalene oxidase repeat-containing protein [Solirubrobacterales bacterium]|nr:prenyltransferase/squalene oxidase repeat-containing protein [Solirubrobacterales bacterium]
MRFTSLRLALLATALAALLVPASAAAKASSEEITTAKNKGVEYLKGLQKESGEIPGFGGDWALTALAAAGTAPADVNKAGKEGSDARSWYEGVVGAATWPGEGAVATDPERGVLLAYAAGIDPARVSKRQNLIAKVASFYQSASPGYYGETLNGTVFGLLALAGAKTTAGAQRIPQIVLDQAVEAVKANQHTDGGWTWAKAAGSEEELKKASEPDMTGAAMAALCSAGVSSGSTAITNAKNYLVSIFEGTTGAFKNTFGNNTDSNAWAVQGLKACGIDPQGAEFTGGGSGKKTPIDFLIAQQQKSGGFRYGTSGTTVDEYASQDAIRALGSGGFTATPPKPKSGSQFKGVTEFATGEAETTSLALIVDDGSSPLKICSVTLAPKATTTTLAVVLNAAVAGTTPASCVTSFLPGSGEGAITQINGAPAVPAEKWNVSIDNGTEALAKRSTVIHVGDTIYLKQQ